MLKILGAVGALLLLAAGGGVGYLEVKKPAQHPPSSEIVERTPARLARGRYLVEHVTHCLGCHSDLQTAIYGMPPKPGTLGQGGYPFDDKLGVPGLVCAQNITPDPEYGIGRWTDGEVLRAMREGVDRDGNALFPMMPYASYRSMSEEDARSIVAYIRTLPPIHHSVPEKHIDFPVNLLVKSVPQPLDGPVQTPDDAKDHLAYGKYMVTLAGCQECHTPHDDHGQKLPGKEYSGGWVLTIVGPPGQKPLHVVPPNITPDPDAYFGKATKEQWIGRVRSFASMESAPPVATPGRNTIMGWVEYAGLSDQDLGAVFDYIKTVPPLKNNVEPFPDAPAGG
jgi:mono/diheme cytochrome c family protein